MGRRLFMSKGCGCQKGILKMYKPPKADLFYAACCIHDDEYDIGGNKYDRKKADTNLFFNCVMKALKLRLSVMKTLNLIFIATMYYTSVRLLGSRYFNYK